MGFEREINACGDGASGCKGRMDVFRRGDGMERRDGKGVFTEDIKIFIIRDLRVLIGNKVSITFIDVRVCLIIKTIDRS
jgi:hypothetical protein